MNNQDLIRKKVRGRNFIEEKDLIGIITKYDEDGIFSIDFGARSHFTIEEIQAHLVEETKEETLEIDYLETDDEF